jgi:ribosomal protein S18 acetylase RimI-like enzyme
MDALPCTIRPACPSDVPAIQAMKRRLALAEGALHAINASEADWQRDLFGQAPRFAAFIAELAGTAVGMMILSERFFPGWSRPVLHVHDLFVVPERRCRGVGRALLARAAREAISRQATFVELDARKDSQARRLYRKAGFARVHNHAAYVLTGAALSRLADVVEAVAGLIS